jgi:hypothetical protein
LREYLITNQFIVKCPSWDNDFTISFQVIGQMYACLYNEKEGEWKIIDSKKIMVKRVLSLEWETYEFSNGYAKAVS